MRSIRGGVPLLVGLVLAACTSAEPSTTFFDPAPTTTEVEALRDEEPALDQTPSEQLASAIDTVVRAGSYSFTASVRVGSTDASSQTLLTGWVDGADRLLTVELDGQRQTTYVTGGTAVVERDGVTTAIDLVEAGAAPSLTLLEEIDGLRRVDDLTLRGSLPSSVLGGSGFALVGDAEVSVRLGSDGALAGYDLVAQDQSWTVTVDFAEVGVSFER